jgi:hypothetical protein
LSISRSNGEPRTTSFSLNQTETPSDSSRSCSSLAGPGVKANLLGTTTRKDGKVQVTYSDHPLYFDNETGESHKPGEIGCQQYNVNGGIWLIMKPNGQPNRSPAKPHHE